MRQPNEIIVAIGNGEILLDADDSIYVAELVKNKPEIINGNEFLSVRLLTNFRGEFLSPNDETKILISPDKIISNRPLKDIALRHFYVFGKNEGRKFVIKGRENPFVNTSRFSMGSGVFGRYIADPTLVDLFKTSEEEEVFRVYLENPFYVQDKEHCESVIIASMNTNRFLDSIMSEVENMSETELEIFLQEKITDNIFLLWNFVFDRYSQRLDQKFLVKILANYLIDYGQSDYKDFITQKDIFVQPINYVMLALGYDGIIGSDLYTNSTDRGCVCFIYDDLEIYGSRETNTDQ